MSAIVIYYSWSGHTEQLAKQTAEQAGAQICRVEDQLKPSTVKAYTAGCLAAIKLKSTPIEPLPIDLHNFTRVILMAPVWAGHPAPAINSVIDLLPSGKEVEVRLVSASGSTKCKDKVKALINARGCKMTGFENIKG